MIFENMTGETYVRARAEQLAMQTDLAKFQELYLARGLNFGSLIGNTAQEVFDAFIAPYREIAQNEFMTAFAAAKKAGETAFTSTLEAGLMKSGLTGKHDTIELSDADLEALKELES